MKDWLRLYLLIFAVAVAFGMASGPMQARENHALLIGASSYQNLDERWWLLGPANDVDLVARYLEQDAPIPFEKRNITILADGVPGAALPTLAAIRSSFADLTRRVQAGDFVYLHFSGHGSQAPALNPASELDGLDELFLPIDVGTWSDRIGQVENALVDDEIGEMIGRIKDRGAEVWVVFDSCHSGTATRGGGAPEVRLRKMHPSALGIPAEAMNVARPLTRGLPDPRKAPEAPFDGGSGSGGGSLVAFFAAQTNETTPEKNMPPDADARRSQGVFTYTLFQTLAENPALTYRQLGQEVLRKYSAYNLAQSTPLFEGDLNRSVFAAGDVAAVRQWPARVNGEIVSIPAGQMHGLVRGETLALMTSPTHPTDRAVGFYEVADIEPLTAELFAVDHEGREAIFPEDLPRGSFLRKINANLDFSLSVALPPRDVPMYDAIRRALDDITGNDRPLASRLRIVEAEDEADIRLQRDRGGADVIYFMPASGVADDLSGIPSVRLAGKAADALARDFEDNLERMSKAINLVRVGGTTLTDATAAEVQILTRNRQNRTLRALDFAGVPRLVPGDEVHIRAHNPTSQPVDVNLLHIGVRYGITHLGNARLQPGDTLKMGAFSVDDSGFGRDRIIAVLTPAKPQSIVENLKFLEQRDVPTSRDVGASPMKSMLRQAGFGSMMRAFTRISGPDDGPGPKVMQFAIDTVAGG